jgi:L-ribulose-5-phosphate 4-epimerase
MRDEGVTKYQCIFNRTTAPAAALVAELNSVRHELFTKGLIGVYPDGIGYGNVSVRIKEGQEKFIITGTQTGHKPHNEVQCEGLIAASSESMTHAAVYELDENIRAVIHVHSRLLWERGRDTCPMTEPTVPYGTPQMAYEMRRLYEKTDLRKKKILLMLGHEEGVITFGADLREALRVLFAALAIRRPEATSFPR